MGDGLFGIGLSGLTAAQRGLATAGHNVANVNTPGFSRQSVGFVSNQPQRRGESFIGRGVSTSTVRRAADAFVTEELRSGTAQQAHSAARHDLSAQLDNLLADPAGGLSPAIQQFFDGLHGVAADPASVPARQVALSDAGGLVRRFHSLQGRLEDIRGEVEGRIADLAVEASSLASNIAELNAAIVREQGGFGDRPANDLLDQRDELVRRLSAILDVRTVVQDDGALNVLVGNGQALVTGQRAASLTVVPSTFDPRRSEVAVSAAGSTIPISELVRSGELAGVLEFRRDGLDAAERAVGHVALGLARAVNDQHRLGQTLGGAPGGDFFTALDQLGTAVLSAATNTGAAAIGVTVADVGNLPQSAYTLERIGGTYQLTRLADDQVFTLSGFPGAAEVVDGLVLTLDAGTIADGDRFLIEPTRFAARRLELAVASPQAIAAAAPVRASAALGNTGDAAVASLEVNHPGHELGITFGASPTTFDVVDSTTGATLLDDAGFVSGAPIQVNGLTFAISGAPAAGDVFSVTNTVTAADGANTGTGAIGLATVAPPDPSLRDPVTLTFTSPTTFDVAGATTGTPVTGLTYTSGAPISFNGWTLAIAGTPQAGDVFAVEPNTAAVGDNRNAQRLAALQTTLALDGERSTFEEVYGQLVAAVGTTTRQAEIDEEARSALLAQVEAERDALAGVNLDEEAADLIRFQQHFQASAQVIRVADEIFQTLLAAVGA